MNFETSLDKAIEFSLDNAIKFLDIAQEFYPFSFLMDQDGKIISIQPDQESLDLDSAYLIDAFKDFGVSKLEEENYEGLCVTYKTQMHLRDLDANTIAVFLKFKNDPLPLKTRVYYFPYTFENDKPKILFEAGFSSEA